MSRPITDYGALTFDCFGTLVDWESGIFDNLLSLRNRLPEGHDLRTNKIELLKSFIRNEGIVEHANPDALYDKVLGDTYALIAKELGVEAPAEDQAAFGASVGDWPVFPDTTDALKRLQKHFKLVILSNVDRASFGRTLENQLPEIKFDAIYTAQDIGTYKPNPNNFKYLAEHCEKDLGVKRDAIIHTAYALFHDLCPAHEDGLATCWIERLPNACGGGAPEDYADRLKLSWRFPTMGAMADYVDSVAK
jgi:2-haloalkanoic acid dehalogenase type II